MTAHENLLIHRLFEGQAESHPDKIALTFEDQCITYRNLNARANELARFLIQEGVVPGKVVAICLERSVELIYTLLAVLKSGGTYLPLDPDFPEDRLDLMLEDSSPALLITHSKFSCKFRRSMTVLNLDSVLNSADGNPNMPIASLQPAYLIYTSGSTGKPKGVMVSHLSVVNFLRAMQHELSPEANDNFLAITTISFDIAVLEIFLPLSTGSRCDLVSKKRSVIGKELGQWIQLKKSTVIQATPSTWELLLGSGWKGEKGLKLLCGGEKISERLARYLTDSGGQVWNVYGPTETTVWSTCGRIYANTPISIGHPLLNTQTFVLNEFEEMVPLGIWGELYIGGDGVAIGYLNKPALTATCFLPDSFTQHQGSRLYKTGDLARYVDGQLECGGRNDHQIKYLGYRIEPGDIESVISENEEVCQVVVVLREKQGDKSLAAYIVSKQQKDQEKLVRDLRNQLEMRLPHYMVPRHIILLDALPLTSNGKINRLALPDPKTAETKLNKVREKIQDPLQAALVGIWSELLQVNGIRIDDNFFKIGGHSLLATQVIFAIQEKFDIDLPLRDLFTFPTVRTLSERINTLRKSDSGDSFSIKRNGKKGDIPLSFAQQRLYFIDQMLQESGEVSLYNIPAGFVLEGPLNIAVLREALDHLIKRHEVLQYRFKSIDSEITQGVDSNLLSDLRIIDLSVEENKEKLIEKLVQELSFYHFDLFVPPLVRTSLIRSSEQEHILLVVMHHIISDAWSLEIFFKELSLLYNGFLEGKQETLAPLSIQYSDFALWQQSWLKGQTHQKQLAYWHEQLKDIPELIQLPWDRPRPMQPTHRGAVYQSILPRELMDSLLGLCEKYQVSLYMVMLTIFKILLFRYTDQNDIVVGTPISNRRNSETNRLIGFFVNTIALRTRLEGDSNFGTLLLQIRDHVLGAYENQDIPFEQIVDQLQLKREVSRHPVFQVMFLLDTQNESLLGLKDIKVKDVKIENQTAKFDLTLWIKEEGGQLTLGFEYATDLFDERTIRAMASHLQVLTEEIIAQPDYPISQLPLLDKEEKHTILDLGNKTEADLTSLSLHELFEEQAEKTPDKVAIVCEDQCLSYRELNAHANRLARYLRELGVGPEGLVGICLERSIESIIALMGILKAGGCYVPMDPDFPDERVRSILEDTQLQIVITRSAQLERFRSFSGIILRIDADWELVEERSSGNLTHIVHQNNRAFVIFTSGSTGRPKGVVGHHLGVINRAHWMLGNFPFEEGEVFIHKTALNIVDSFFEIYDPLLAGATLAIVSNESVRDLEEFVKNLRKHAVSRIIFVPTYLDALLDEFFEQLKTLRSLKTVLIGGEAVTMPLAKKFQEAFSEVPLINLFGATETTAEITYKVVNEINESTRNVPIGTPIANSQAYILNECLLPNPRGVIGELYVGGLGLVRGYLNQPGLTAVRFLPHLFSQNPGERVYRIGDLGKFLADGSFEYLGRNDFQINIRGFRVEPIEIETVLNEHPFIQNSVVVARQASLIAYIQPKEKKRAKCNPEELRQYLLDHFPGYMIPDTFMFLERFSLTSSGKINRKELPEPDFSLHQHKHVHARNDAEFQLAKIWEEILQTRAVGIFDNFFDIGGNSLLTMRLVAQIKKKMGKHLPVGQVFKNPTIAQLSKCLSKESTYQDHVIQIQSQGAQEPLYLVHPALGLAFAYNLLGLSNLDRPIYGINNPFWGRKSLPYTSIKEMAADYIKLIPANDGPYILGGWSFGGIMAYEMAQQLTMLHRPPQLLLLIDSFNHAKFGRNETEETPEDMQEFLLDFGIESASSEYEGAKIEIERNIKLAMDYNPTPYAGKFALIKASISEKYNQRAFDDPYNGWKEMISSGIQIYSVPCRHAEMFDHKFAPLTSHAVVNALRALRIGEKIL